MYNLTSMVITANQAKIKNKQTRTIYGKRENTTFITIEIAFHKKVKISHDAAYIQCSFL